MKLLFAGILFYSICFQTFSQQSIVSTGANIKDIGGEISYSVGQTAQLVSENNFGEVEEGIQQASEIFIISSLDDVENTLAINMYPNPVKDYVCLEFSNYNIKDLFVELTDINGKIKMTVIPKNQIFTINLKEQVQDLYFINIYQSNKKIKTYKLVKTN